MRDCRFKTMCTGLISFYRLRDRETSFCALCLARTQHSSIFMSLMQISCACFAAYFHIGESVAVELGVVTPCGVAHHWVSVGFICEQILVNCSSIIVQLQQFKIFTPLPKSIAQSNDFSLFDRQLSSCRLIFSSIVHRAHTVLHKNRINCV